MAGKDRVWDASEMPRMTPVSWTGKRPLGTAMYRKRVSPSVPTATSRVADWWPSTKRSVRAYTERRPLKAVVEARAIRPTSCASRRRRSFAHSMGVRVRDTAAETRMAAVRVSANSRNRRPTISPMNRSGISTAIKDTVSERIVKPICPEPFRAASSGGSPASM